jgi:C-terminal processing protease CtpA/Prc
MQHKTILAASLFFLFIAYTATAQNSNPDPKNLNPGFEQLYTTTGLPAKWYASITTSDYGSDSLIKHSGKRSAYLQHQEDNSSKYRGISMGMTLPINYSGKKIQLKGFIKTKDIAKGTAGLIIRLEGSNYNILLADAMIKRNLQGTNDWAEYTVEVPLLEDAKFIYFGAYITGNGKLWLDDVQLSIDGKDISNATSKPLTVIDNDKEFDKGSSLNLAGLNPKQLRDLKLLGKIWGFLKYNHPAVSEGQYHWDYELFRIIPKILSTKTNDEKNDVLISWINGLGTFESLSDNGKNNPLLKISPDAAWLNDPALGAPLVTLLNNVKNAKRPAVGFYAKLYDDEDPVPIFRNEVGYEQFKDPDDGYRLLTLFRFWNAVEYYFPYKYAIGKDWDEVLDSYLSKFIAADNETSFRLTTAALVAEIHDSHADVSNGSDPVINRFFGDRKPAIEIKFAENQPVVTANYDQDAAAKQTLRAGDVIRSFNGISTEARMQLLLPYTSASNYPTQLRKMAKTFLRTTDSTIHITYSREGKNDSVTLKTNMYNRTFDNDPKRFDTTFKIIKPGIAYINPGVLRVKDIPVMMKSVMNCKALIIDMRSYPKETSVIYEIGRYLYERPTTYIKYTRGSILHPGEFEYLSDSYLKRVAIGDKNKNPFKGRLYILIDETTQSFAEMSAMAFQARPNTVLIGSQTAGADGTVFPDVQLPGGMSFKFTGVGIYYMDGKETQRVGIVPDIEVKPTIKGITAGLDEVLERALLEASSYLP